MASNILKAAMIGVCLLFFTIMVGGIEGRFAPVVTEVEITETERAPHGYTRIWGEMKIERPSCDFRGVEWDLVGLNRNVLAHLIFEEGAKEREGGWQDFGPWLVQLTEEQLFESSQATAFHKCPWRWWRTESRFF